MSSREPTETGSDTQPGAGPQKKKDKDQVEVDVQDQEKFQEQEDDDDGDSEEDDFDYDYYNTGDFDQEILDSCDFKKDPEYFEFECLSVEDVERLLNESVEAICSSLAGVTPSLAKVLLHTHKWNLERINEKWKRDPYKLLTDARIKPLRPSIASPSSGSSTTFTSGTSNELHSSSSCTALPSNWSTCAPTSSTRSAPSSKVIICNTCLQSCPTEKCVGLCCNHLFCKDCWSVHLEIQVTQRVTIGIECMAQFCHIYVPEEFALNLLTKSTLREKYQQFAFSDYVRSHPQLRFCPGVNCNAVVRVKERHSKRVICKYCKSSYCFKCGAEYHAPTDCDVIKKWLTKCADDSETANYISAHTKDCPKCHICIEKNGGCNHMQCYSCKHDFCWMCLGDWKSHGSEYYECSRYKENPNIATESVHAQAREALKKYLFYYERWENHSRSLRLEEQTLQRIKERIHQKVMANKGTWIDWQYLLDAACLLAKCRYSLQYTYPYAYFLEPGPRKQLFEWQQAQLEAEIENLSWKVERAETTDRGELENQMDIAEKRRTTLLKDFLPS